MCTVVLETTSDTVLAMSCVSTVAKRAHFDIVIGVVCSAKLCIVLGDVANLLYAMA